MANSTPLCFNCKIELFTGGIIQLDQTLLCIECDKKVWTGLPYYRPVKDRTKVRNAAFVLGINENASLEFAKAAYRKLALIYHPDRLQNLPKEIIKLSEEKFVQVQCSYDIFLHEHTPLVALKAKNYKLECVTLNDVVICLFCNQKCRIPSMEHHETMRCGECHALLLFEPEDATKFHKMRNNKVN